MAREVTEEAGVAVGDVVYRSSQPWPFPASLMLGFTARYTGGEAHARDGELEALGWFDRDELVGMRDGRDELPPSPTRSPGAWSTSGWTRARCLRPRRSRACSRSARLPAHADVPAWVPGDGFVAVTRTRAELSIVCAREAVPADVRALGGYAALEVAGPLDPASSRCSPGSRPCWPVPGSVFAVSTHDTDYLLVRAPDLARAQAALDG